MKQQLYQKCKNLTVLFIEDYIPLQKKISSVLSDYFDHVQTASDGREGFETYEKFYQKNEKFYDIVITDYEMPKINGMELIKKIKKINNKQIFIVISAHQNSEYLIEYINLGVVHFLSKPVGSSNLLEVLNKVGEIFVSESDDIFHIHNSLIWNKSKKSLLYDGSQLDLAKYDLLLVEILLENFGFTCTTDNILNHFYRNNEDIKQENIRNMIVRLRKKIPGVIIESVYGMGYKFVSKI